ncbi:hypothetical protein Tco_1108020 [Tanacetum coccineum]
MGSITGSQEVKNRISFMDSLAYFVWLITDALDFEKFVVPTKKNKDFAIIDILNFKHMILENRSQSLGVDAAKMISSTYMCTRSSSLSSMRINNVGSTEPLEKSWDIRNEENHVQPRRGELVSTIKELSEVVYVFGLSLSTNPSGWLT